MNCPICNDNLIPVKLSPGTVTHEHQTGCAFVWNDLTVPQIEVLHDAALGAALRRMPPGTILFCHESDEWGMDNNRGKSIAVQEKTPEAVMIAAGLMKGEK